MALPSKFTSVSKVSGIEVTFTEISTGLYRAEWEVGDIKDSFLVEEESLREEIAQGFLIDFKEVKWLH